jgi:hypothetical protein
MDERRRYLTMMGRGPTGERIPHWEAWSNPDAETYLTGIDYYSHPRLCRLKMQELYPELGLEVPEDDTPKRHPRLELEHMSADRDRHTVRWGDGETDTFEHGEKYFKTEEDVFGFDPLSHADMRRWKHVVENWDFSSEEVIYQKLRKQYPADWDCAPAESDVSCGFYNTAFMWPLLTFGWEQFLACSMDERFEPVMAGFAEINRRVFKAMSRLPVNFVVCHDDIVMTRGPVCSPEWMNKYIFPRYEEYWSIVRATGKEVIFMTDGCADAYIDDVISCGARGLVSEPYTDYKAIARRHKDFFLTGEGDNRILSRGNPDEIRAMVDSMLETSRLTGGYMMSIGNHIPWNVPGEAVKTYLDLCNELAWKK